MAGKSAALNASTKALMIEIFVCRVGIALVPCCSRCPVSHFPMSAPDSRAMNQGTAQIAAMTAMSRNP